GPVVVVLHVVLARPGYLDRSGDMHGQLDGFGHVVLEQAPAEAAAEQGVVDVDVAVGQGRERGRDLAGHARRLGRAPDVTALGGDVGGAVHGLHGGVGEVRDLVHGVHGRGRARDGGLEVAVGAHLL